MNFPVILPALGESVSEATITRWLKKEGDEVAAGEPIVEVSTDKVDTEVISTVSGSVVSVSVQEGETVSVGTTLALIFERKPSNTPILEPDNESQTAAPALALTELPQVPPATANTTQTFFSPLVRHISKSRGIDLGSLNGTGAGGRVRKLDLLNIVDTATQTVDPTPEASATPSLRGSTVPMSRLRKVIASRAVESFDSTAQLTAVIEVDVTRIDTFRNQEKAGFQAHTGVPLTFLPFFSVAATRTLQDLPIINARIVGDRIEYPTEENVNIAVDTPTGVYTPVVREAGRLDVEGYALAIDDVTQRARAGTLKPEELTDGTFTIINTGSRGALFDTPVVFPPQVAILGLGLVTRRPVVIKNKSGEGIAIRSMVYLALSYDHRAIDGADAATYLSTLKVRLESEEFSSLRRYGL